MEQYSNLGLINFYILKNLGTYSNSKQSDVTFTFHLHFNNLDVFTNLSILEFFVAYILHYVCIMLIRDFTFRLPGGKPLHWKDHPRNGTFVCKSNMGQHIVNDGFQVVVNKKRRSCDSQIVEVTKTRQKVTKMWST